MKGPGGRTCGGSLQSRRAAQSCLLRRAILVAVAGAVGALCASRGGGEGVLTLARGGGVSMALVRVPAGKFLMGSSTAGKYRSQRNERPQHEASIPEDFLIGRCEVTRGQFAAFVRDADYKTEAETKGWTFAWDGRKWDKIKGASWRSVGFDQTDDHPVICVSWTDAAEFCKWLGGKASRTVRLPTEAQW